ncbi:bZIP transcription factor 11-like [Olea europaea var. sylvestris]|uniref:BZIP transcription factor 11-like n=1 Tax=Olea europaea subsp. europaea TaxID=158383 RepID=A0A8S0V1P6_OLEEU|nr:bZIP transcription factor 11-like [Olea europaea var. sylvestris]CAA3024797.1 bZIP transcription factor 11-like [Olea europaea subsp. europaea]
MDASSGNSSGTAQIQNSHSEDKLQDLMDQRKRTRMQSNRESARRSRMKKQKRLDDLSAQIAQLRNKNSHILTSLNLTTQDCMKMEAENLVLKAQFVELSERLQSLNEILNYIKSNSNRMFEDFQGCPESLMYFCQ